MNIIKSIDLNNKKNYTIIFNKLNNNLEIKLNNNKILTSEYNFYGILQNNNIWIWASSIPGTKKSTINKINNIKNFSHLFENNNNKRSLFYHQFLTQDIILITDDIQKKWINSLLIYLDNSIYFLNPKSKKNNTQFITLNKIYEKYI